MIAGLICAGTRFTSGTMPMGIAQDEFLVVKPPDLTAKYLQLVQDEAPQRIVEIGVKEGGSTAMITLLAQPALLLAVELAVDIPPLLSRFIADHDLGDRVVTAFGTSQDDRPSLTHAADSARSDEWFDLVIDDASHILGPTAHRPRCSFPDFAQVGSTSSRTGVRSAPWRRAWQESFRQAQTSPRSSTRSTGSSICSILPAARYQQRWSRA